MEKEVEQKIKRYLQKARQILEEQKALFDQGFYSGSVSRGYYAIFNLASAILLTKRKEYSSHQAVIANFGKEFVKENKIDAKYHQMLIELFVLRQTADYDIEKVIDKNTAKLVLNLTHDFQKMTKEYSLKRDKI
jgi:uncharacterized protein (UPF0332 family)